MKKEFQFAFQINKTTVFEVEYCRCVTNQEPYFATAAETFSKGPKTDYNCCGQCQNDVLPKNSAAMKFFEKWDSEHLKDLSQGKYDELITDLETLKEKYNFIDNEDGIRREIYHHAFSNIVALSKLEPKKATK